MKKSKKLKIERIEKLTSKQGMQLKGGKVFDFDSYATFRTELAP